MIGIIITIAPIVLFVIGYVWAKNSYSDDFPVLLMVASIIAGVCIIVFSASVYIKTSSYPVKRASMQETLDYARSQNNELELAAITAEVMKFNRQLDTDKNFYYPHFWLWMNDDILTVERIK